MAVPKRKVSKSRRDKRRTHQKTAVPTLSVCPQCKETKLAHHVCHHCGYYKGRTVIESDED